MTTTKLSLLPTVPAMDSLPLSGAKTVHAKCGLAKRIRSGQVFINNYGAGGGVELPFGGSGHSGHGREKGFEALYGFFNSKNSRRKTRLENNIMMNTESAKQRLRLSGKRAIVTGGASGFGAGIVRKFLAEGASVMIADING